jgi:hypothetical protein
MHYIISYNCELENQKENQIVIERPLELADYF